MDSAKLIAVKEVELDVETQERAEAVNTTLNDHTQFTYSDTHAHARTHTHAHTHTLIFIVILQQFSKLQLEVDILRSLSHKNIVKYWGADIHMATVFIFMEFIAGGSLQSIIKR